MARFSVLALLTIALSGAALAAPREVAAVGDVRAAADPPYTLCDKSPDDQITSVSIDPDSPKVGQAITLKVKVNVKEDIEGGSLEVGVNDASSADNQWTKKYDDICSIIACPIKKGEEEFDVPIPLPEKPTDGDYTVFAIGSDKNGKSFFCFWNYAFKLAPSE